MRNVWGKLYSEVLPELNNQEIFTQRNEVYFTGISIHKNNQRLDLLVNDELKYYYFNYNLTPLLDEKGNVHGVLSTAVDVTDFNLALKKSPKTLYPYSMLYMDN